MTGSLEFEYNPLTDILKVDKYTVGTNLDEIESHQKKIKEILNNPDLKEDEIRSYLTSNLAFLDYLQGYYDDRYKKVDAEDTNDGVV